MKIRDLFILIFIFAVINIGCVFADDNATSEIGDAGLDNAEIALDDNSALESDEISPDSGSFLNSDNTTVNAEVKLTQNATYQYGNFTFQLTDTDSGENVTSGSVSVKMGVVWGDNIVYVNVKNINVSSKGTAVLPLSKFFNYDGNNRDVAVGVYDIEVAGEGNLKATLKTKGEVKKSDAVINPVEYSNVYGSSGNFTFYLQVLQVM